ncbi:major facilitator superfamily transporter [Dendryphion nanum]|uniref:Major facilitator superfamily transporter n=1 Tax=Dendryphion nanum TaxID=256645 RepID=A0A9P9IU18_9PLEO|nr:major facilitator superfamily transporter [Dendryphion nanum]
MSLYEPSVRSSRWSLSQRLSRPFTTLEGWREIGLGVYAMSNNIRIFSIRHQFDPDQYRDEQTSHVTHEDSRISRRSDIPPVPSIPRSHSLHSSGKPSMIAPVAAPITIIPPSAARRSQFDRWDEKGMVSVDIRSGPFDYPYHVYSYRKKWLLVGIVTVVAIVAGLTPSMYLPSLNTIARDFKMSLDSVTLTITSYFIAQAMSPLFWNPLSERFGRRPIYIITLLVYISASVVLSLSPNYLILIIFRGVQAAGISSGVSMGCAVIRDISNTSERDSFLNFYQAIRNVTIVLGPVIGGALTNFLNFRAIFVFQLSIAISVLVLIVLFLPESLRRVAGDGSTQLSGIYKPLAYNLSVFQESRQTDEPVAMEVPGQLKFRTFAEPLLLFAEKDIAINLISGGTFFTFWMMVTVSTIGLFHKCFNIGDLYLGLSLIPNALGAIVGSTLMGNLLNHDIILAFSKYKAEHTLPPSATLIMSKLPANFPLEHTRLRRLSWITLVFTISLCGYGFTLAYPAATSRPGWIALPLVVQFLIASSTNAICAIHQTLVTDLWHQNGYASNASSNLVKCILAAFGVGLVQALLDGVGPWSAFLALGLVVMVLVPLPLIQWYWGHNWRAEREAAKAIVERFVKV